MTKRDIVVTISKKTGIKQITVKEIVQAVFDTIFQALKEGKNIEIRNFGVFKVKIRKPRKGRNPRTGEFVPVPERKIVVFKPGREMKAQIH